MKFYLIVTKGKKKGLPIPITVDLFMVGSGKECQLRVKIPGTPERQVAFVTREKKVFVRDLDSGEATLVNGSLLPPGDEWPLHKGDKLELGQHLEFMLQFREKPLSQRDLEEWALGCLDQSNTREFDDPDAELSTDRVVRSYTPSDAAARALDQLSAMRGEVVGRLRVGHEGNITIIRFNDRYLVEEPEIKFIHKELHDHLDKQNLRVLLDCKNVKRMSTSAVKMFDDLCTWLKQWGSTLALCRVHPDVVAILKRLDLHNRFPIFPDKPSAISGKW